MTSISVILVVSCFAIPVFLVVSLTDGGLEKGDFTTVTKTSVLGLAIPSLALSLSFPILAVVAEFVKNLLLEKFSKKDVRRNSHGHDRESEGI